jgi:hypothetical protein
LRSLVAILLQILVTNTTVAETIILARGGEPAATIVIPPDCPAKVTLAATDLQHYVTAICGVELPIQRDGKTVTGTGLYIGQCEPSRETDLPDGLLNPETYAIRVRDGNLFFAGRHPTPTYFAVVSFLEDTLGVRWFAPGPAWEYVPQGTPGELAVEQREVVKVPDTSPRIWSGHAWFDSWKRWNLRNKTVLSEVIPRRNFQNYLHRVFPPSKYAETHPEYYPLIDGERWIPPEGKRYWRPCESNPEVLRLTVEYARRFFDEHPDIDSFSLGMDDISHLCSCENCRALDPRPDSYEKREFSDRHYKFVNAVAREVAKTHPDRYIGTLIYNIARTPPETVPRLEDNVFGYITETSALWWEPGRKEADHALTREWTKRCNHLSRYDYYGMGTFTPRFYPHTMAEQIKFDKSLGLEGMYTEVYTFLPHTAPMIWALAKLQWDASLDIDDLLNEFYSKMFGRAAGTMSRYFDLLERSWNTPRPGRQGWVHRNIVNQALAISPEAVDEGMALLSQAAEQAETDVIRGRIDTIRAALQYAGYAIRAYALSEELIRMPIANEQDAQQTLDQALAVMRSSAERESFWATAMKRDDLLGENLRGLGGKQYLVTGEVANLEKGVAIGATRALHWYADQMPDRLAEVTEELMQSVEGGTADTLRGWLWVRESDCRNLVTNPGFEASGGESGPQRKDWQSEGTPAGWSAWSRTGRAEFRSEKGGGRGGSNAASISRAESACYLQAIDVRPGQRYLCTAYAKAVPHGEDSGASMGVRFQNADGAWHPRRDLEPRVQTVPGQDWQSLILFVTVPEDAGRLVILLSAKAQPEGSSVLFDDVALYQLPEAW